MGEKVLLASKLIDGFLRVVLVKWRGEWVTWILNEQTGSYNHGHYFEALDNALIDYLRRIEGYNVTTDGDFNRGE